MAAVEPELRDLLYVLLDADLSFDLSSSKYPHFVGGAVAAMLQEVRVCVCASMMTHFFSFLFLVRDPRQHIGRMACEG